MCPCPGCGEPIFVWQGKCDACLAEESAPHDPAELHPFRPHRDDLGDATLACRTCKGWYDEPQHERIGS